MLGIWNFAKTKKEDKMKKKGLFYLLGLSFIFILSGCVVRTYQLTKDRVDQDLNIGNRGYLIGEPSEGVGVPVKKKTRTIRAVEIELHTPIKFEKTPKPRPIEKMEDKTIWGNRGYITKSEISEISEKEAAVSGVEKYTVQKGDTLQKISHKFYGTTKRWNKIYEANKDVLKSPNKIYPGQTINIPVESLKEPRENLK